MAMKNQPCLGTSCMQISREPCTVAPATVRKIWSTAPAHARPWVGVVLYAESPEIAATGLVDVRLCGLGTFHFEVDLVPGDRRRGARLRGLGNLRDLRRDAGQDATR
jgi:hypothetical protein